MAIKLLKIYLSDPVSYFEESGPCSGKEHGSHATNQKVEFRSVQGLERELNDGFTMSKYTVKSLYYGPLSNNSIPISRASENERNKIDFRAKSGIHLQMIFHVKQYDCGKVKK